MRGKNINTKERILKEEHAYLEEVAAFLDDNIKNIEIHCKNLMEESKLPYAGSTEERRHVQYLRKTVANEREQIRKIEKIKEKPYFGRMDFNLVEEGAVEYQKVYIGEEVITDTKGHVFVYDWRSDIGNRYYVKNETSFNYNTYRYELLLRRALDVKYKQLRQYKDEYNEFEQLGVEGVKDPFLLQTLRENRGQGKLTDIIRTIQHNQNEIIRAPLRQHMIIQGCAGSGKTMILLHRLSYLFYQNKELNASEIKIITPSEVFNKHIDQVIIKLGVNKAERYSVKQYYEDKLAQYNAGVKNHELDEEDTVPELATYFYSYEMKKRIKSAYREWRSSVENKIKELKLKQLVLKMLGANIEEDLKDDQWIESLHYQIQRIVDVNAKNKKKYSERKVEHATLQISLENLLEEVKILQEFVEEGRRVYSDKLIKTKAYVAEQMQKRLKVQQELRENQEIESLQPWETYLQQAKASRVEKIDIQEQVIKMNECFNKRTPDKVKQLLAQLKQELSDLDNETSGTYRQTEAEYQILVEKHALIMKMEEQHKQIDQDIENTEIALKTQQEEIESKENLLDQRDITIKAKEVLKVECEEEIIALKKVILSEQIIDELLAFNKLLPMDSRFLESEIYNKLRRNVFKEHKFTYTAKRFKFDLYCLLQLIYLYKGPLRNCDKYLYIDEAQDLGIYEYELFYFINNKQCYFNLYGDLNQLINKDKGIKKWDMLNRLFDFQLFEMKENYRNTTQIANYCKEKVGFDTVPIGLQGESVGYHKFTATSIKKALHMLIISKLKRKAIIINQGNEELYNVIVKQLPKGSYQRVQQGDEQVTSSKIFILTVEMAKGLEFDDVLVFTKGMNKNSKYIAFTRALNHLSVVGSI